MEGTEPRETAAGLLEHDVVLIDHLDDVDALFDGVEVAWHQR